MAEKSGLPHEFVVQPHGREGFIYVNPEVLFKCCKFVKACREGATHLQLAVQACKGGLDECIAGLLKMFVFDEDAELLSCMNLIGNGGCTCMKYWDRS